MQDATRVAFGYVDTADYLRKSIDHDRTVVGVVGCASGDQWLIEFDEDTGVLARVPRFEFPHMELMGRWRGASDAARWLSANVRRESDGTFGHTDVCAETQRIARPELYVGSTPVDADGLL